MQNSDKRVSLPVLLSARQIYSWCFVFVLLLIFFAVLMMSGREGFLHFDDNFYQRDFLIENFNHLRLKIGDRVFPDVLIGKNGWMEYTGDGNLNDFQNAENYSPDNLRATAREIESCYQYAKKHNITFLMVVAPNKASIYPDTVPEQIQTLSNTSQLDQLNDYLKSHGIPEILDLRSDLRNARKQRDVYYKTDTHWNGYGAYVAYAKIINVLSKNYPALHAYSATFFRFRESRPQVLDISGLIYANFILESRTSSSKKVDNIVSKIYLPNPYGYHEISWIQGSDLPSVVMFHDSFGYQTLNDLLALNFSKAYYFHRTSANLYLNPGALEQFAPNILIYEIAERDLYLIQNDLLNCAAE